MIDVKVFVGRTCTGLFKWLRERNLHVPSAEEVADITADLIKAYKVDASLETKVQIIKQILDLIQPPDELKVEVLRQFARVADTYMAFFDTLQEDLGR